MEAPGSLLSDQQRLAWLRLIRTPQIGPALFRDLVNLHGSAQKALDAMPDMGSRRGVRLSAFAQGDAEREIEQAKRLGAYFVATGEAGYPTRLTHAGRPPPLLCVRSESLSFSTERWVAIVGARNASAGGRKLAQTMARDLGRSGFGVISGLARGIDHQVHVGALASGTFAFLAGGLGHIYPPEHEGLANEIVANGGALYSEMPIGWTARAQDFPKRNRLVAGSSLGTVVVEASKRSGSLITARQAGECGREVMAVPGFPLDPRSEGPNALLRDGAVLVRDAQDVLQNVTPQLEARHYEQTDRGEDKAPLLLEHADGAAPFEVPSQDAESLLTALMSHSPIATDTLIETSQLPAHTVRGWLVENELVGRIVRSDGDRFAFAPDYSV